MSHTSPPLPRLKPREADGHKGTYGRALLIGGSRGMAGAIALSGMATLRSGAGLVKLATPECCQNTVAGFEPALMTVGLPAADDGRFSAAAIESLEDLCAAASVCACGPGLGQSEGTKQIVQWLYRQTAAPCVLDADALNVLAGSDAFEESPPAPRILTPHPGEFARLLGRDKIPVAERESLAVEFAKRADVVLILKGHQSIITDGQRVAVNRSGNPGMATGGTGDVLTGIVTGLLCQGLSAFEAAQLGAHIHGRAGDLAAAEWGEVSLIASDLIRYLGKAFLEHAEVA